PVIAAVNGAAYGGGLEMALACDIVIAAEHAIFALSEPRVGVAALAGGVHRLARQIGLKQAMGMLLNGRKVSAAEAHELGFVNEVVPAAELMATAQRWAAEIAACAPLAVRATKQLAMSGLDLPLREAMAASYPMVTAMLNSPDMVEGARAFAERRAPNWQG
ncbi:MAG: enoyl-CoA hydratase/isomerase family protein, partial [Pseudomonadales bacterium]|nr:enoyl-CoA hydratase/isomerase family protein [Pseudomonadales bacterium]